MITISEKLIQIAENPQKIYEAGYEKGKTEGGVDASDATASADEIFADETAYTADGKITGTFTIDSELEEQGDLISQIAAMLEEKAGGGIVLPTLTNPASNADIISDKEAIDGNGNVLTGTIVKRSASDITVSGKSMKYLAGYYDSGGTISVGTATQATPSVSIDSAGKITATATQSAGYVSSGTKTATKQLTTKAAATITPSTTSQTAVNSGVYTTGAITVAGDANLVAGNIKNGVSIFGVNGTYEGSGSSSGGGTGAGDGSIEMCTVTIEINAPSFDDFTAYSSNSNLQVVTTTVGKMGGTFQAAKGTIAVVTPWYNMGLDSNQIFGTAYNGGAGAWIITEDCALSFRG